MSNEKGYSAAPICHPDGRIDIAVRSSDGKVICTTLATVGKDVAAAISQAYESAKRIADALNAYNGGQP
jgi:hypothetical protein